MSLRTVSGDIALPFATARAAGNYSSGPIANPGATSDVVALVHCTAITGTSPTVDVVLQTSPDNSTWTSVTGGATAQLTAAGNAVAYARCDAEYIQVKATIGGTASPTADFQVAVMVIPS